jgi:hypothetical protein
MRCFLLTLMFGATVLNACAPAPTTAEGCAVVQTHAIAFSGASTSDLAAGDMVEARSFGPDCATAIVTLTFRAADGAPLWTFAAPARKVFPETTAGAMDSVAALQGMDTQLRRWVRVMVSTTADQPRWAPISAAAGSPPLPETGPPAPPWSTPFDQATYADLRERALPMACFETSPDAASCVYWEAAAGEALLFLEFQR